MPLDFSDPQLPHRAVMGVKGDLNISMFPYYVSFISSGDKLQAQAFRSVCLDSKLNPQLLAVQAWAHQLHTCASVHLHVFSSAWLIASAQ